MPGLAQPSCQLTKVRDANSRSVLGWPRTRTKYEYEVPAPGGGTRTVRIRDDAAGHAYSDNPTQNRGPHFNDDAGRHYDYPRWPRAFPEPSSECGVAIISQGARRTATRSAVRVYRNLVRRLIRPSCSGASSDSWPWTSDCGLRPGTWLDDAVVHNNEHTSTKYSSRSTSKNLGIADARARSSA